MTKYPSLYAALDVADRDGRRGAVVRCSATLVELGFIYWTFDSASQRVTWHYRSTDGTTGETTTERNAVQRLRDLSGQQRFAVRPQDDDAPKKTTTKRTTRIGTCTKSPACAKRGCDDCERAFGPQVDAPKTTTK